MGSEVKDSLLWISHRGLSVDCDENTIESFDAAVSDGFTHIETDLRVCASGEIVLCHDDQLQRIAGVGGTVRKSTKAELERVALKQGGKLLFFEEFVDRYEKLKWTFDIKAETGHLVVSKLLSWTYQNRDYSWLKNRAKFLFWNASHQRQLLSEIPDVELYARRSQCILGGLQALIAFGYGPWLHRDLTYAVPPNFVGINCFRPEIVARYHAAGTRVTGYLPDSDQVTRLAMAAGVDEILTNGKRIV